MTGHFRCLILGAAGRDFHDFLTFFRAHPEFHVCGFTAAQIPHIECRSFPVEVADGEYTRDIPIFPETRLAELIQQLEIDFVFLAHSDLAHEDVMHKASLVQACGAAFALLGPRQTQLRAEKPVLAVTAVRTGAGTGHRRQPGADRACADLGLSGGPRTLSVPATYRAAALGLAGRPPGGRASLAIASSTVRAASSSRPACTAGTRPWAFPEPAARLRRPWPR